MAIIVAVRSGNWSDTSHVTGPWPGASTPTTKPGVDDTVQTEEDIVITIDEDVTVALLEAVSTGYFEVTSAPSLPVVRTITANVLSNGLGEGALKISNPSGKVVLIGDINVAANRNTYAIYNTGVMGNITGNVTGGSELSAVAIVNNGTIGDVIGNVTGGSGESAFAINSIGTMGNVIGNVTGGLGLSAIAINSIGTMGNVIGNVTGGSVSGAIAISSTNGTMGNIDGSLICGANGLFPISGSFKLVSDPANAITVISSTNTLLTLSNDYPAEADVKDGVDYNRGTMTGELAAGGTIGPVSIVIGGGGIRIS